MGVVNNFLNDMTIKNDFLNVVGFSYFYFKQAF